LKYSYSYIQFIMRKYTRLVPFLNIIKEYIETKEGYELASLLNAKVIHSTAFMNQVSQVNKI